MTGDPQPYPRGVEYPSLENSPPPPDAQWAGTPNHQPPHPGYSGYPGYPGYGAYPPPGGYGAPRGTNTNAIIAVIASAAGLVLCGAPAIVGVVLGVIAMRDTRRTGQDGHGLALTAVILGALVLAFYAIYVIVVAGLVIMSPQWAP
ncbi:DUF4190 domain-containing protein [Mycobacterium sp. CPCC 205372]|uniref:DUF4190 domain-containing protein n=1 Tax=Mycobacterium hippophais TaxID=3016340 RepID=A0ABT4PLF4_9MYCO|nr:DUF4190 domain-containing protein [Mycobacterium hippophais]MCZ8377387.1 DUF4190 domain-containing protein [Mycobacterium hippophais]